MIGIGISPSLLGRDVGGYPLDSYSGFRVVFSIRRLLTSYTGDLIRLRRDSDDAESDFGFDANGDLDTAAITTWLGGADGLVVTWYDQSGNGYDATQATDGNQPQYIASGINSKPVFRNNPSAVGDKLVFSDEAFRNLTAATMGVVSENHTTGGAQALWGLRDLTNAEVAFYMRLDTGTSKINTWVGNSSDNRLSNTFAFTDPHIFIATGGNGILGRIYVDGTEGAYDNGKQVNGTTFLASYTRDGAIGQIDSVSTVHDAENDYAELFLLDSVLSAADRAAIEADQSSYFNI